MLTYGAKVRLEISKTNRWIQMTEMRTLSWVVGKVCLDTIHDENIRRICDIVDIIGG